MENRPVNRVYLVQIAPLPAKAASLWLIALASTLLLSAAAPESLNAEPFYEVKVVDPGHPPPQYGGTLQSTSPGLTIQDSFNWEGALGHVYSGSGFARGNQSQLSASIDAFKNYVSGSNSENAASAEFIYDDVVFSSPTGTPVDVTLPLHLFGSLTTAVSPTRVIVEAKLNTQNKVGTYRPATGEATGLLSGLSGGVVDTTLFANYTSIPVNTPMTLRLKLSTDLFINGNNSAFADFDFSLVTGGPTFIVPEGVSANSEQGGIIDNLFVPVPGDMNCDGFLNGLDVAPFVLAVLDGTAYQAAYSSCSLLNGDLDGSGVTDDADVLPFANLLVAP